ncbi:MAG: cytidine deaminase [Nanoarchaeota archaeon]
MKVIGFNSLSDKYQDLVKEAEKARESAYNPYSKFYVGAALLSKHGTVITGANVENASYGLTLCAERSALARANVKDVRALETIAISTRGETFDVKEPTMPCGACRQWIYEFAQISDRDIEIISASTNREKIVIAKISELLPNAFGPKDLGINIEKYQR